MRLVSRSVAIAALGLLAACGAPTSRLPPESASVHPTLSVSSSGGANGSPAFDLPAGRSVRVDATIPVPGAIELVGGENHMWMLTGDSVTGIDPATNEVAKEIPLPFRFGGMVEAASSLWFPDFDADVLHRYDLPSRGWLNDVAVMHHPNRIGVHDGSVWVGNGHGRWVSRIDPAVGAAVASWSPLEDDSAEGSAPPGAFWGTSSDARQAYAIDPSANSLAAEIEVPFSPCAAQPLGEKASVAPCIESGQEAQVALVGASGGSSMTIELPGWPVAMMPIEDRVWLPLLALDDLGGEAGVSTLIALDPSTGEIKDVVDFDRPVYGVALGFNALWVSTSDSVLRIPLTEFRTAS